jgi:hypothetical protein
MLKKLKYYIQHIDGVWSIPLAFLSFWIIGIVLQSLTGYGTGTYDPGFIQPLFLSIAVVIGATNAAVWGVNFTFRGLYKYLYGQKVTDQASKESRHINYSKKDWKALTVWQRYIVAFFVFFYYVSAILIVYLKLV